MAFVNRKIPEFMGFATGQLKRTMILMILQESQNFFSPKTALSAKCLPICPFLQPQNQNFVKNRPETVGIL